MKIYKDIEQRTPEWFNIRKLKFTASNATAIRANGKGLETLAKELVREYYSSRMYPEYTTDVTNKHINRGCKFEDMARTTYELETGNTVETVAFIERDMYVGCSPDGLVGDKGLIEIKNPDDKIFYDFISTEKIDSNHYNQIQMQLAVTGREWCDYFVYNPNFTPSYKLVKIYRDEEAIKQIEVGLVNGKILLKQELENIKGKLEIPVLTEVA